MAKVTRRSGSRADASTRRTRLIRLSLAKPAKVRRVRSVGQAAGDDTIPGQAGKDAAAAIASLTRRLAQARRRIALLEAHADTDFLLDIPNRRGFERELERSIAYVNRYRASAALLVIDVDRLKPVNDRFGHTAGDYLLKIVVGVLAANIRQSDMLGRLGGDEFGLLLWKKRPVNIGDGGSRRPCRSASPRLAVPTPRQALSSAPTGRCTRARPPGARGTEAPSSDDVRRDLVFDEGDTVAQLQFALLQSLQLQQIRCGR